MLVKVYAMVCSGGTAVIMFISMIMRFGIVLKFFYRLENIEILMKNVSIVDMLCPLV